jgi:hypothetical protein
MVSFLKPGREGPRLSKRPFTSDVALKVVRSPYLHQRKSTGRTVVMAKWNHTQLGRGELCRALTNTSP